jgi:hypothetical protein
MTSRRILLALSLLVFAAGCSKKQAAEPTPALPTAESATPAPTQPTAGTPTTPVPVTRTVEPAAGISATEAALKAKQYEEAAAMLLAVQNQKLTEQQADAARSQMARLQRDLAGALASGDPKAKAAADLLRRSSTVR